MKINFFVGLEKRELGGKQIKTEEEYDTIKQDRYFPLGARNVFQAWLYQPLSSCYCVRVIRKIIKAGALVVFMKEIGTCILIKQYLKTTLRMSKGWGLKEIRQSQNIAHFKQKNLVNVENVYAGYEHFLLLDSSIFCDELHQSYSGEMCDKLENHLVNYL